MNDPLTLSETAELFNLWFIVIIVSDFLAILGSIYKIAIEQKVLTEITFAISIIVIPII